MRQILRRMFIFLTVSGRVSERRDQFGRRAGQGQGRAAGVVFSAAGAVGQDVDPDPRPRRIKARGRAAGAGVYFFGTSITSFTGVPSAGSTSLLVSIFRNFSSFIVRF